VKAYLSKRAARAAERIAAKWQELADDPNVFAHELLGIVSLLESTRSPGSPYPTLKHPALKRILMRKSRCHVYFEIDERNERIEILHMWDARRGNPPRL
jgi:hypothetical protein